jgi:phosphoribosylformylglycinamidine synthase
MPESVLIEVSPLPGRAGAGRRGMENRLSRPDCKGIDLKKISAIYRLEGNFNDREIKQIARELLCDPIVEQFSVNSRPEDSGTLFADVWFKRGVTDSVGDSVLKAASDLRISSVRKASSGTRYAFSLRNGQNGESEKNIIRFAEKELLNPLIQECEIVKH